MSNQQPPYGVSRSGGQPRTAAVRRAAGVAARSAAWLRPAARVAGTAARQQPASSQDSRQGQPPGQPGQQPGYGQPQQPAYGSRRRTPAAAAGLPGSAAGVSRPAAAGLPRAAAAVRRSAAVEPASAEWRWRQQQDPADRRWCIAVVAIIGVVLALVFKGGDGDQADPTPTPTTSQPTGEPTGEPTSEPTGEPTEEPTAEPTGSPTTEPTTKPNGGDEGIEVAEGVYVKPQTGYIRKSVDGFKGVSWSSRARASSWSRPRR